MLARIGVPRALLYYKYYPWWKSFFEELGFQVVVSCPTNKALLVAGVAAASDETCLPVKAFYGHVLDLKDRVDYLFIPRMISVEKKTYTCPKFLGLPDIIRGIDGLPPIIETQVNRREGCLAPLRAYYRTGEELLEQEEYSGERVRESFGRLWRALWKAERRLRHCQKLMTSRGMTFPQALQQLENRDGKKRETSGKEEGPKQKNGSTKARCRIGLIGHGYNIYDSYVSKDILHCLEVMGASVWTADMVSPRAIHRQMARLPKDPFWSYEREVLGAAFYFLEREEVDGIIQIVSLACGPDSMIAEMVYRQARRKGDIPYMLLTIDEHSSEVGVVTRLEAFLDMIHRGRKG
ncbi:hypothetical protein HKBW3S03_00664 [Candidatus Hakubella thermalkaliphila]|uniref:DUF2229 domain-containing protein n=2 Tax=Candidatus Hakubella thermalkaliphila TaxID=2754717 RepID=A0A6V8PEM0_9ACTN|nr:acyl-CoA dehydratase activase-related protein [Candidatus Hakubella thermalkaliphila]GFP19160.1 hypothetical protein HKBW3S03_00664 [Candidatus Hakubella thermalkaliphila]GFP29286.1 hypothetical protein HKBW3S34_00205 [Candidatus Hakubella thermalkaliphila]GFP38305.1 hypothetical protein HKBW3S47_00005 [Candidatus Hakubella thermalkaliphila]